MQETLFTPLQSLAGGALIGMAAVLLMATMGRIMGATGILAGFVAPVSGEDWRWRVAVVVAGMVSGLFAVMLLTGQLPAIEVPVSATMLVLGELIVGVGIPISGMANLAKVLNLFDIAGTWDPSLVFVMGGALVVTFIGYRVVLRRPALLLAGGFQLPTRTDLDLPLNADSAIFGVGWGIAGFCPGGALPALGTGRPEVVIFVLSLIAGIIMAKTLRLRSRQTA